MTIEELINKLKDYHIFSQKVLKLVDNSGELVPFIMNEQQNLVHQKIEQQLNETGRVRAIILKSRKLGMSTYVAGRFVQKTILNKNRRAAVITHVTDSSSAIFRVYKRFIQSLPDALKPQTKRNNIREIEFLGSESSIKVATAGAAETGRGDTVHLLHCSEIAFWPNAAEIAAGLMRSVADVNGTEIIIESTAASIDSLFYTLWSDAVNGLNGYLPIFIPWTADPTCRMRVPDGYTFTPEEETLQKIYDLSPEQVYWRSITIRQLGEKKFKNEYPISAEEAFASVDTDSYIGASDLRAARTRTLPISSYQNMPLILGVDVAAMGSDKTCVVWRRGDCILKYQLYSKLKNEEVAEELVKIIRLDKPKKIFIDGTGGYGGGVAAILRLRGHECEEINFGSKSSNGDYANKRAEIYGNMKEWLSREVQIPNDDKIEMDLLSIGFKHNMHGQLLLESKAEIKKRLKRSPDIGDAMALTFSYPVTEDDTSNWQLLRDREIDYIW